MNVTWQLTDPFPLHYQVSSAEKDLKNNWKLIIGIDDKIEQ